MLDDRIKWEFRQLTQPTAGNPKTYIDNRAIKQIEAMKPVEQELERPSIFEVPLTEVWYRIWKRMKRG